MNNPLKEVPYLSQNWAELLPLEQLEQLEAGFAKDWSYRSCGLACILMALHYFDQKSPSIIELQQLALAKNAFNEFGLIHAKAADLLQDYGMNAKSVRLKPEDLTMQINSPNILFIASVGHAFNKGNSGHLVLVYASNLIDETPALMINDPSPFSLKQYSVKLDKFGKHYSNRGILIHGN
jgi:ABC-type bacteriocin/lantibiotic exporter with double-glycine peptidase domain